MEPALIGEVRPEPPADVSLEASLPDSSAVVMSLSPVPVLGTLDAILFSLATSISASAFPLFPRWSERRKSILS